MDKSEIYASRIQETISNVASCVAKITNMNSGVRKYGSSLRRVICGEEEEKRELILTFIQG